MKSNVTLRQPQMLLQPRVKMTKDESLRVIYLEIQEMVVQATAARSFGLHPPNT